MPKFVIKDGGPGSGPQPGGGSKFSVNASKSESAKGSKEHRGAQEYHEEAYKHHYARGEHKTAALHDKAAEAHRTAEQSGQYTSTFGGGRSLPNRGHAERAREASKTANRASGFSKDSLSGKTALAGDSKEGLMPRVVLSPVATVAKGALMVYLGPRMAADAAIDLHSTLKGVKGKNFRTEAKRVAIDVQKALKGKLAQDADVDDISDILEEIAEALESEGSVPEEGKEDDFEEDQEPFGMTGEGSDTEEGGDVPEVISQVRSFLQGKLSPEDQTELDRLISGASSGGNGGEDDGETEEEKQAREERERREQEEKKSMDRRGARDRARALDEPPPFKGRPNPGGTMDKKAMDAAIKGERKLQRAIAEAERYVRPWVGDFAMDEAEHPNDVYGEALKLMGHDVAGVDPSAYKFCLDRVPKPGSASRSNGGGTSRFAQDGKPAAKSFAERFPNASRIGNA